MTNNRRIRVRQRDPRYCHIVLDANALDRDDQQRSILVDKFLNLAKTLPLSVFKPHGVESEIQHQNTPTSVQGDMDGIYTIKTSLTPDEKLCREKIRQILKGNSNTHKHNADSDHIFEAYKYGGGYFITHDKRFEKKKAELNRLLDNISIVTLEEFVKIAGQPNP